MGSGAVERLSGALRSAKPRAGQLSPCHAACSRLLFSSGFVTPAASFLLRFSKANSALYRAVIVPMRYRPASTACVRRRTEEGKTNREIIRCLRRYLAREIYRYLLRGQIPPPSRPKATPPTENRDNVNGQRGYSTPKGASTPSLRRSSRRARKSSSTAAPRPDARSFAARSSTVSSCSTTL